MAEPSIAIEVVYAPAYGTVFRRMLNLAKGATVAAALEASGVAEAVPGFVADPAQLGVFSRKVGLEYVLRDGDRLEIYRPLTLDPKEARRRRAQDS
ncbi:MULTISPECIES: RnfH family protein [Dyella]|uniref:UPF0125 protein EZM97_07480 n=2 Tax=Dyella TaxID=231454 RepID=A0A4R0YUY5_9GAMM|nr:MULTISPECIES: RnfH family protein [Dyella]TBR39280.1 RnfH family protein [Dyella terrae]TCI13132.1 RnfH family protein [Dyella soli]